MMLLDEPQKSSNLAPDSAPEIRENMINSHQPPSNQIVAPLISRKIMKIRENPLYLQRSWKIHFMSRKILVWTVSSPFYPSSCDWLLQFVVNSCDGEATLGDSSDTPVAGWFRMQILDFGWFRGSIISGNFHIQYVYIYIYTYSNHI